MWITEIAAYFNALKHNYDTIAPFYDRLAKLFFGNQQIHAQKFLIAHISSAKNILIIGGGPGWILEEITVQGIHAQITYIDASEKMITLAKRRSTGNTHVIFINSPIEQASLEDSYDVIITPFLFDNLPQDTAEAVVKKATAHTSSYSKWLYCDFSNNKVAAHGIMLQMMYLFFGICCGIKARRLPDLGNAFSAAGYHIAQQQTFMRGFIVSTVYERG